MMKEVTEEQALDRLMAWCAAAEHCEHDVRERLAGMQIGEEARDHIVDRLYAEGFLDQRRYCCAFVRDKFRLNKWGRLKIREALRTKRLPSTQITEALECIEEEEYAATIRQLVAAKERTLHDTDPYVRQGKVLRYMASRGFEVSEVAQHLSAER